MNRLEKHGLQVDRKLAAFIDEDVLPGLAVTPDQFWQGLSRLVHEKGPRNRELLAHREALQAQIDEWHIARRGQAHDPKAYKSFLEEIGYLLPEGRAFEIDTANVDPEIATVPGPQLVVPVMNARYAINAANARFGSLYDVLYGTDAIGSRPKPGGYDLGRGARVVTRVRVILDDFFPLDGASHGDAKHYSVDEDGLSVDGKRLEDPGKFLGYRGDPAAPEGILLTNNGLHVELYFNRDHPIGRHDQAGMADVILESAVTAIMDCEDSVAAVDAEDKVLAYSNWLGLMKGTLQTTFEKGGKTITRRLLPDRSYKRVDGSAFKVKGRALMWVRNVGHLMTNPAILDRDGNEVFEGLLDAMCTTTIAMHDLKRESGNSVHGSIYVVKPKMHGPDEVAFANEIFDHVEETLGLPRYTVKLGIMDEERRTSVNLKECIRAARHRVAFINTGFLDRTGDEIHTSMEAGPFSRKDFIKRKSWITAYENQNVDVGLECGLQGRAQIGKGMWAVPDEMAAMLKEKIAHPMAGANCAWVPSPTAATLHALHYHQVDVFARQNAIRAGGKRAFVESILDIPLATYRAWSDEDIIREVENNAQGILGYVVRWVDQGIGCSTVPDINNVGLMEDRATCRISAQHIANWLHHGVVTKEQVETALRKMALVVDEQNADDLHYERMAGNEASLAYQAAYDLIFLGRKQPSGYTEPLLHAYRSMKKKENVDQDRTPCS
ncbi:malate synthase G [Roseovarius faecimaris]|uniref:Malate synthase G n=1 Tax=Roseovarius faecimaris TaxID=2494550 RepID=A0A6I6IWC3_9RHOB|nr:malate synthase G [Roseovarius faecimaris]QGX99736.1 malate synthase G [Roseovarius faecimaris]